MAGDKSYQATMSWGRLLILRIRKVRSLKKKIGSMLTEPLLTTLLLNFVGEIDQLPPMYSALKKDGKRSTSWHVKGSRLSEAPSGTHRQFSGR